MPQYHFTRDDFCKAWECSVSDAQTCDILSQYDFVTSNFIFRRVDDEFYIIHMDSGIIINWYKHLGRINRCNRKDFTFTDLCTFIKVFVEEYYEEIATPKKPYEVSATPGPDIKSMYPKIMLNSVYGTCLDEKQTEECKKLAEQMQELRFREISEKALSDAIKKL